MMKNKTPILIAIIAGLIFFNYSKPITRAATASANNQPAPATENLKLRIEKVVQEKREQIKGIMANLTQKKRGLIGQVQRISESSITISTDHGTKILPLDPKKIIIEKKGKKIDLNDIAIEDWLTILAIEEGDDLLIKKIIIQNRAPNEKNFFVSLGNIKEIGGKTITILPRNQEETIVFKILKKTDFQDASGEKIQLGDIDEETQALIIGYQTDSGNFTLTIRSLMSIKQNEE